MHNRKCNCPPHPLEPFIKYSPESQPQGGKWQKANPRTTLPPWHRHNQGRTRSAHREGGGGQETRPPSFKHTGLKDLQPRLQTTRWPANSRGLIYVRPPRISPLPTDLGVSPGARAQSWLAVEAASLLPFPAPKERGAESGKQSETGGQRTAIGEPGPWALSPEP